MFEFEELSSKRRDRCRSLERYCGRWVEEFGMWLLNTYYRFGVL